MFFLVSWGGVGGPAEAAGKVRKGNPSGTGDLTIPFRTTPAPRWGTAISRSDLNSPYPRGTPQSGFRRSMVCPGNIPAKPGKPRQEVQSPRRSRRNHQQISAKSIKIWSGRVPGASRIGPGPFRNEPERRKCQKLIFGRKNASTCFCRGRFCHHFGIRPGPQNQQKTSPGPKTCVRRRRRKRFL